MALTRPDNSIPVPALLKRFALIYLPIVMVLSIILLMSIRLEEQIHVKETEEREIAEAVIAQALVMQDIVAIDSDLRIFARLPLLRWYLDSGNPAQREELEKLFLVLAQETRRYDQVRYLDTSGQEVIRINYNGGKPAIVPREQLQNKKGRYYFDDTFKLNQGEIFVSPLDLNIEHGSLELPHKPMIRFGTPVFDSAGRKKGIILFNYLGDNLLQHFQMAMHRDDSQDMLLNRDGYWLSSAKPEDEWGFMLDKKERTFGHDFPEEWRAISAGEQGTLLTDRGLFVYTTAYPLLLGQRSSAGSALAHAPSQHEVAAHEYYWKIVAFVPHDVLSGAAYYNKTGNRIALSVVYLLFALGAWAVASVTLSRKRAEETLRESELRFRKLFENSNDAIFIHTFDGRILDANPQAESITGYSLADLKTRPIPALHPHEEIETSKKAFEETISKGSARFESLFLHSSGTLIDVEISASIVDAKKGIIQGVVRDITERKKAEECLEKQKQELEIIIDSSPIIIFYKDKGGRFLRVNKTFAETLQIPKELFLGKTVFDLYSANIAQGMTNDDREVLESGCPKINIVEPYESASGIRWAQTDKVPIFSADGITTGLIGFAQDITERKKAEDSLRESDEKLKAILNSTTDAVFLIDTAGNILAFNETTALRLGKGKDEIIGTCIFDYLPPDIARSRRGYVNEAVRTGKTVHFEDERDGEWIDNSIYPIFDEQKKIVKVAIYARYITERKKVEREMTERELRYRSLFERENSAVMIFDGETLQFEDVNQKALSLFGYTKEEFLNLKVLDISAEKEKTTVAVQKIKNESLEYRYVPLRYFVKKDGTVFPGEIFPGTFMYKGRQKIIGGVNDITERKKAEDELKRVYEELQEKTKYLEKFNRRMVGRELEMINLKAEVNELLGKAGQPKKYEAPDEVKEGS